MPDPFVLPPPPPTPVSFNSRLSGFVFFALLTGGCVAQGWGSVANDIWNSVAILGALVTFGRLATYQDDMNKHSVAYAAWYAKVVARILSYPVEENEK
jgi:hypothetical protein